jgi:transposase InsO family protein
LRLRRPLAAVDAVAERADRHPGPPLDPDKPGVRAIPFVVDAHDVTQALRFRPAAVHCLALLSAIRIAIDPCPRIDFTTNKNTPGDYPMHWLLQALRALLRPRLDLVAEVICLRQQLALYQRRQPHPRIENRDRRFWIVVSRLFARWRECLMIVQPETVLRWHRSGWRAYWRWKCAGGNPGRERVPIEVRELIRRMAKDNPLWGAMRILGELLKLGCIVSPRTVAKYMQRPWSGTPSPRWGKFLAHHAKDLWACDFLTVRTLTFQTLYVFFIIRHDNREIVHARVTAHPASAWVGQQIVNACFDRAPPKYLLRDRDSIYGAEFSRRAVSLNLRQIRTPVRAPKANAIAERCVGTLRREGLDHLFIFNERHLQNIVNELVAYYNPHRPHRSLGLKPPCPEPESTSPNSAGPPTRIIAEPVLGGLHHVYKRAA